MTLFPLYSEQVGPFELLNDRQLQAVADFNRKTAKGDYTLVKARCVCGSTGSVADQRILDQDRYGINIGSLLCAKCGTIRTEYVLTPASLAEFYRSDYRPMYVGDEVASDKFFADQEVRGHGIVQKVRPYVGALGGKSVFEIGCGAGGILQAFKSEGSFTVGCDFGEAYLAYGRRMGLDLRTGEIAVAGVAKQSQDIIILVHVLEHFLDPISKLQEIWEYIRPNGHLVVEVPGIFEIFRTYIEPMGYFQFAHPYCYHASVLRRMFNFTGFEVLHGDQSCFFVLRKRDKKTLASLDFEVAGAARRVRLYLGAAFLAAKMKVNPYIYRRKFAELLK